VVRCGVSRLRPGSILYACGMAFHSRLSRLLAPLEREYQLHAAHSSHGGSERARGSRRFSVAP
jgi:hypothetical protein